MNVEDNARLYDACQLVILGEACTRLSPEFRAQYNHVPWRQIIGMRNRIIHGYDELNWEIVWQVATEHVPQVIAQFSDIIAAFNQDSESP